MTELTLKYFFWNEFARDSTLTELPSSRPDVEYILPSAFQSCSNLTNIFLSKCESVGSYAFNSCYKLAQVSLPQAKYIWDGAFYQCSSLTSIYLPEALYLGGNAFGYCSSLTTISLPKCKNLGGAFTGCSNLSYVYLPECLRLGNGAFYNCKSLSYAVFKKVVCLPGHSSDTGTFASCNNLWSVYFLEAVPFWFYSYNFGYYPSLIKTFQSTPITSLTYSEATGQSEYGKIYVRASLVDDFKLLNSMYSAIQDRFVGLTDEEVDNILNILDNGGTL